MLKRGYQQVGLAFHEFHHSFFSSQRSLVMLTKHQFPSLFSSIISHFGPLFEIHGTPMLEAACHNIAKWWLSFLPLIFDAHEMKIRPDPEPGCSVELGFLGSVVHVEIPHSIDVQMAETSFKTHVRPIACPQSVSDVLSRSLQQLRHWCRLHCCCSRASLQTYGLSGSVSFYVNLSLFLALQQLRQAKQYGGCEISCDPFVLSAIHELETDPDFPSIRSHWLVTSDRISQCRIMILLSWSISCHLNLDSY